MRPTIAASLRDSRYTRLSSNEAYFAQLYADTEARRRPMSWWIAHRPLMAADPEFPAFYHAYYAVMARSAAAVAGASRHLASADLTSHPRPSGAAQN